MTEPLPHEPVSYRWMEHGAEWAWDHEKYPGEKALPSVTRKWPMYIRLANGQLVTVRAK